MDGSTARPPATPAASLPDDHPGRWVGGALGVTASLAVAIGAVGIGAASDLGSGWIDPEFIASVGILGAPIGWVLGRAALPLARDGGWAQALAVGFGVALVAPPLGGLAWLVVALIEDAAGPADCGSSPLSAVLLLPFILPWSYLALVATVPAALLWGVLARLVPAASLAAARMPPLVSRLGTRHLLAVGGLAIALILAGVWLNEPACSG
jgi:hypothetical protein